jgi:hypothetical protein
MSEVRKRTSGNTKNENKRHKYISHDLHSNVIMCISTLLIRWHKRQSSKISHDFQPWNWYHENYSIVQSQTRDIKQLNCLIPLNLCFDLTILSSTAIFSYGWKISWEALLTWSINGCTLVNFLQQQKQEILIIEQIKFSCMILKCN